MHSYVCYKFLDFIPRYKGFLGKLFNSQGNEWEKISHGGENKLMCNYL